MADIKIGNQTYLGIEIIRVKDTNDNYVDYVFQELGNQVRDEYGNYVTDEYGNYVTV